MVRLVVAGLAATGSFLLAGAALADPPAAAPLVEALPERHPPSSIRLPLALGGLGVAGAAYGLGAFIGTQTPEIPGSNSLLIPVVGPWIALAKNDCATDDPDCGGLKPLRGVMLAFDGVVQIAGLAMIGEAIFLKTEAGSGRDKKSSFLEVKHGDFTIRPTPMATGHGNGIGFVGSF